MSVILCARVVGGSQLPISMFFCPTEEEEKEAQQKQ